MKKNVSIFFMLILVGVAIYYDYYREPVTVPDVSESVVGTRFEYIYDEYGVPTHTTISEDGLYNVYTYNNKDKVVIFYSQGGIIKSLFVAEM